MTPNEELLIEQIKRMQLVMMAHPDYADAQDPEFVDLVESAQVLRDRFDPEETI